MKLELIACTSTPENLVENVAGWLRRMRGAEEPRCVIVGDGICEEAVRMALFRIGQSSNPPKGRSYIHVEHDRVGPVGAMQRGYEHSTGDILAFIHDDVVIHEEGWDTRVLAEFEDPSVGVVGFGGALGLGTPGIYKTPYRLQQLARTRYASNVDDAEVHGERFAGVRDVVVLDGFSLIMRRSLLEKTGGWPDRDFLVFHNYDAALAVSAARQGMRTRLVGCRVHHKGGGTSTRTEFQEWHKAAYGISDAEAHTKVHAECYERWRDVLPLGCTREGY